MPTLNSKIIVEAVVSAEYYFEEYFAEGTSGVYHNYELSEIELSIDYESQDGPTKDLIQESILEDIRQKKQEAQSGARI